MSGVDSLIAGCVMVLKRGRDMRSARQGRVSRSQEVVRISQRRGSSALGDNRRSSRDLMKFDGSEATDLFERTFGVIALKDRRAAREMLNECRMSD